MKDRGRETEEREKDKKRWNETEKWREGVNIHITLVPIRGGGEWGERWGGKESRADYCLRETITCFCFTSTMKLLFRSSHTWGMEWEFRRWLQACEDWEVLVHPRPLSTIWWLTGMPGWCWSLCLQSRTPRKRRDWIVESKFWLCINLISVIWGLKANFLEILKWVRRNNI